MDDINTEEFINEIEIRPAIWNSKSDKYSNRTETRNAWEGICEKFIEDFQNKTTGEKNSAAMVLQKKWRHIRDAYARDLKKQRESKSGSEAKTKRKYVYFDRLQFLSELYEIKPDSKGKNNQTGDAATASTSKSKSKNSSTNDNDETNTLLKILAERLQNKRNSSEDVSEDGDRYFLLSLLNDFKRIPESRKMDAKYDIIGIIRKYAAPQSYTRDYYSLDSEFYERGYFTNQSPGSETQISNNQLQPTSDEMAAISSVSNLSGDSNASIYKDLFSDDVPT
ncbi:hypothetical protein ACJJTC_011810 [Scirpophaga incertulas]